MSIGALHEAVVALERDPADFDQAIGRSAGPKPLADIFSYMADHSTRHADQIRDSALRAEPPPRNIAPLRALQARRKSSLRPQVESEDGHRLVLERLAQAEEIVGQIYRSLSLHFRRNAAHYQEFAAPFEKLAREEGDHRNYMPRHRED